MTTELQRLCQASGVTCAGNAEGRTCFVENTTGSSFMLPDGYAPTDIMRRAIEVRAAYAAGAPVEEHTELHRMVQFDGWMVDLFKCSTGNLGLTIEREPSGGVPPDENPSIDIFVAPDLRVHGEGVEMLPSWSERQTAWAANDDRRDARLSLEFAKQTLSDEQQTRMEGADEYVRRFVLDAIRHVKDWDQLCERIFELRGITLKDWLGSL